VTSLLGVIDLELLFELTDILIEKNLTGGLLLVNKITGSNQNLKVFVAEFLDHLYDLYVIKNYNNPFEIISLSEDHKERYRDQANKLQKEEIEFYMELFTELLKQIKWGEDSKVFFKTAMIKAVNFIILDNKEIEKKTRIIEAQLESLKEEISRINSAQKSIIENSEDRGTKADTDTYEKEEGDFDIINSLEINKMVNEVEIQSNYTGDKKKTDKPVPKDTGKGKKEDIDLITNNMEKISQNIKKKKISVHAMFTEAVPVRIENGILYFHLDEKKEWHRDHLNKSINIDLISGVIKEVTGKDYRIKFELGKKKNKDDNPGYTENKGKVKPAGKNKAEEKDVFNYFEEKFDIKEKE